MLELVTIKWQIAIYCRSIVFRLFWIVNLSRPYVVNAQSIFL